MANVLEHEQEFAADYVVILACVDTLVSIFLCHVMWFGSALWTIMKETILIKIGRTISLIFKQALYVY